MLAALASSANANITPIAVENAFVDGMSFDSDTPTPNRQGGKVLRLHLALAEQSRRQEWAPLRDFRIVQALLFSFRVPLRMPPQRWSDVVTVNSTGGTVMFSLPGANNRVKGNAVRHDGLSSRNQMTTTELQERFQTLMDEHKKILHKVCNSCCRDRDARDDIAQEIIIQQWRSFHKFDERCRFSAWMYGSHSTSRFRSIAASLVR